MGEIEVSKFVEDLVVDFDISILTGYTGYLAGNFLHKNRHYVQAINETVAVDFAHVYSYLGKRSLVVMKNAGLNQAFLAVANSNILGVNAGMVLWVTDDFKAIGSEVVQDSQTLVKALGILPKMPCNWSELYSMTREAYIESEKNGTLQVVLITNTLFDTVLDFEKENLSCSLERIHENWVLHPSTAKFFLEKFNKNKMVNTDLFPLPISLENPGQFLLSDKYEKLFGFVKDANFDIVIGDFGTYTLATGSPIKYALHYGAAIASGVGAAMAGFKTLVITGEGGVTSGFAACLELLRKSVSMKIILIENGGISSKEEININLVEFFQQMNLKTVKIDASDLSDLANLLEDKNIRIISIQF